MALLCMNCDRCGEEHRWEISEGDIAKEQTFNLGCLKVKRLPRVLSFRLDTTRNFGEIPTDMIRSRYGDFDIKEKVKRWQEVSEPRIWFIHDYDQFFEEIQQSYISGSFYPVATACTTLAERLANLFLLKLREEYSRDLLDTEHQRYVYDRDQSWQNHDRNMFVLNAWGLLSTDQRVYFNALNLIRRRAVHYQESFDAKTDSLTAIKNLHKLLDSYFGQLNRKDLLRVFEIPGEIWVREDKLTDPFVKKFVLPNCNDFASRGSHNKANVYHERDAVVGEHSESDFVEQRKTYKGSLQASAIEYEPDFKTATLEDGRQVTCRII